MHDHQSRQYNPLAWSEVAAPTRLRTQTSLPLMPFTVQSSDIIHFKTNLSFQPLKI